MVLSPLPSPRSRPPPALRIAHGDDGTGGRHRCSPAPDAAELRGTRRSERHRIATWQNSQHGTPECEAGKQPPAVPPSRGRGTTSCHPGRGSRLFSVSPICVRLPDFLAIVKSFCGRLMSILSGSRRFAQRADSRTGRRVALGRAHTLRLRCGRATGNRADRNTNRISDSGRHVS